MQLCTASLVTHLREEDLETTEGGGVDFLGELLELVGWGQVDDEETEKDFPWLHEVVYSYG